METSNGATRYNESELRQHANELRRKARKLARSNGFEPLFQKGFDIVYNERQNYIHLQIRYTVNGSAQVEGIAI